MAVDRDGAKLVETPMAKDAYTLALDNGTYHFTFYDRNGTTLNEINGTHTIPPYGGVDFTGNSTSPRAEGDRAFRLELRYPRVN